MVSVGETFDGIVTGVMPFGAFVEFADRKSGLVHISEISREFVKNINDHVKKGDKVRVKVIKIDEKGKINLSIKQAVKEEKDNRSHSAKSKERIRPDDFQWGNGHDSSDMSFEDKLMKFKQISDENIQTARRNADSKRSGGYSRKGSR